FDVEKQVILEEIGMYEDMPSFTVYEQAMSAHFSGHPLGNSVLGTKASVGALAVDQMRAYHASRYQAGNITLAVAGRADWEEIVRLATRHCSEWPGGQAPRALSQPAASAQTIVLPKETNLQQHV